MGKLYNSIIEQNISDKMHNGNLKKIEIENKLLKQEIKELKNTELVKNLTKSLERISKGKYITKRDLGL